MTYGWINRTPGPELGGFVASLAHRVVRFASAGRAAVESRVSAVVLAPTEEFRRDLDLFSEGVRDPEAQARIQAAIKRGFQSRDAEPELAVMLGDPFRLDRWHEQGRPLSRVSP